MYGTFRLALAIMVVMAHMGHVGSIGGMAVKGFFVLSGFLMTMLMDTTYRGRVGAFALNRFLRLYPTYWASMALSALILAFFPTSNGYLGYPHLTSLPFQLLYLNTSDDTPNLLPTAWAVTNEIVMYILIGLGISKTIGRTAVWLSVSALYVACLPEFAPGNSGWDYFYPPAASLPFAVGAMAYHLRESLPRQWSLHVAASALAGLAVAIYLADGPKFGQSANFLFMLSSAFLVPSLLYVRSSELIRTWDGRLGSLSYPLYLIHFPGACITFALLHPWGVWQADYEVLACGLMLSAIIVVLIDNPIQKLRDAVRARATMGETKSAIPADARA